jgi:hypothetical protein
MSRWIDDAVSNRLEKEYYLAEQRAVTQWMKGDWDRAERWGAYAGELMAAINHLCFIPDQDKADA